MSTERRGTSSAKRRERALVDVEHVAMLLEEEADAERTDGGVAGEGLGDDRLEVEELDHLERPPDFLPATADIGSVDEIDERSFEGRDADRPPGVGLLHDARVRSRRASTRADREVGAATERERGGVRTRRDVEPVPDGVRATPVLKRGVECDDGVGGQAGRDEVRVRRERLIAAKRLRPARGPSDLDVTHNSTTLRFKRKRRAPVVSDGRPWV